MNNCGKANKIYMEAGKALDEAYENYMKLMNAYFKAKDDAERACGNKWK